MIKAKLEIIDDFIISYKEKSKDEYYNQMETSILKKIDRVIHLPIIPIKGMLIDIVGFKDEFGFSDEEINVMHGDLYFIIDMVVIYPNYIKIWVQNELQE